ncbi:LysR family transcriptional regulator [Companilactobacillus ginsenosidimutans]|uniref:LysR family transcriptional regulator n=1 Tax=Companilactobacillus ginsenosidimutans TaxID=1007676 RepID=A0A0H4QE03_9LACO|nr:LysR family transcriptional regulator [Companilactobacillus ginsenosidimutans]AKP66157.1 LysR family transcriptional regulator [Companilactobacillus ginsenosidimutans]
MDLRKLKVFLDLAKTLNYSETAERLYTTQGNVSKQILALEKELNVTLFTRAHRKIGLTTEGTLIIPYARKILNDYDAMQVKLNDYRDAQNLTIELHTIPTMPNYDSFVLLSNFLKEHSEIHVALKEEESNQLMDSLIQNKCEIIFTRTFDFKDDTLESIVMENDDFSVVLPKNHQLANRKVISLKELKQENFLQLGDSTNLLQPVINMCEDSGFVPNISYQGVRADLIMGMVAKNMGISIMMSKTAQGFDKDNLVVIPLKESTNNELCFVRKKDHSSTASDVFWNYVKNNR